ncbi:phosphatidic acid phosphatase type 2/haloperoxidase [Syncephalis plumigaleata]|nr:phosphatidic acid phosphatase type 2/haloperoxidase [Syncephalis plumigaleata]
MVKFQAERFRQLWPTYLIDWSLCVAFLVGTLCLELVQPFRRHFSVHDVTISFPYAVHETVTYGQAIVAAIIAPLVLVIAINLGTRRGLFDLHQSVLGMLLTFTLTTIFTEIAKITVGRPRPDFLDRCKPNVRADPEFGLSTVDVCTWTDKKIILDSMRSFMSGHTSTSFAGLGFLSLYMAGKLHIFDERGFVFKPLICLIPLLGAALIGISRIADYRHHWQDVLVGGIVGFGMAYFAYRQYYPSLSSHQCHRPFSPRIPAKRIEQLKHGEDNVVEPEPAPTSVNMNNEDEAFNRSRSVEEGSIAEPAPVK